MQGEESTGEHPTTVLREVTHHVLAQHLWALWLHHFTGFRECGCRLVLGDYTLTTNLAFTTLHLH